MFAVEYNSVIKNYKLLSQKFKYFNGDKVKFNKNDLGIIISFDISRENNKISTFEYFLSKESQMSYCTSIFIADRVDTILKNIIRINTINKIIK